MDNVIAVGHTPWKMRRLLEMVNASKAEFNLFTVFNGDDPDFPADLRIPNDLERRDIQMYREGLRSVSGPWAFFVNDDVQRMDDGWFEQAQELIRDHDCVGTQPNLSHWVDYATCDARDKMFHMERGRAIRFVRTSAFAARRPYFNHVYMASGGDAKKFENMTLVDGARIAFYPRVNWVVDSNTAKYLV